ncbi:MAG: phage scaffolding protein [bacterium]|nr:phage scaffolding protein [bacterium]
MKREDLEALGLSREQIDSVLDMHHKELDPVNTQLKTAQDELKAEQDKAKEQDSTIQELKKGLDEFKDADVSGMKLKIAELEDSIKEKDAAHQKEIKDRNFNDSLKEAISAARGKNARAITALLDVDALKASKNQKEDIAAALKALAEAEDSKMLFGEAEADVIGEGSFPGRVKNQSSADDAQMRAVMGLPPVNKE